MRLRIFAAHFLLVLGASPYLCGQGGSITLTPNTHIFGKRYIGETEKYEFKIQNQGTSKVPSLNVRIVAKNGYYIDRNDCADTLDPQQTCSVIVAFSPVEARVDPATNQDSGGKDQDRPCGDGQPCLQVDYSTKNGTNSIHATLNGTGYLPQLSISPAQITFLPEDIRATSAAQIVTVTGTQASGERALSMITVNGDFVLQQHTCSQPLQPGNSCNIVLNFTPRRRGLAEGVLTITSDSTDIPKREIHLSGKGIDGWSWHHCTPKSRELLGTLLIAVLYWLAMAIVRWNRVAWSTRQLLMAQIDSSEAQLNSLSMPRPAPVDPPVAPERSEQEFKQAVERIGSLFTAARALLTKGTLWRIGDFLFWSRGQEIAGWGYVHEAEIQMSRLWTDDTVKARLETSQELLTETNTTTSLALANRIQQALSGTPPASSKRCQALLAEALNANYDKSDSSFADLVSWQNKASWLVVIGLMLIVALSASLGHSVLFLIGGTGGLLSRLSRSLQRKDVPTDYGASWSTLFLSPVAGALGGWTGILLSNLATSAGVLGTMFSGKWDSPYEATTLGVALLFGVSERAFDSVLGKLEGKVAEPASSAQTAQKSGLKITTGSDLPAGTVGQPYRVELQASGGTGNLAWTKTDGSFPDGLTIDAAGVVSGKPTAAAAGKPFAFTAEVKDATSTQHQTFNIKIN